MVWHRVVGVGSCGVILACCLACGTSGPQTKYGDADDLSTKVDAEMRAERIVRAFLKYPDDASFNWDTEAVPSGGGRWTVQGSVKAMNAFGAKLTNRYQVNLSLDAGTKTWNVVSVIINGNLMYIGDTSSSTEYSVRESEPPTSAVPSSPPIEAEPPETPIRESAPTISPEPAPKLTPRTWTSANGKHTIEAAYIGIKKQVVSLEKPDGTVIEVPLSELSERDRSWIADSKFRDR